jgi:hypothetical protein
MSNLSLYVFAAIFAKSININGRSKGGAGRRVVDVSAFSRQGHQSDWLNLMANQTPPFQPHDLLIPMLG